MKIEDEDDEEIINFNLKKGEVVAGQVVLTGRSTIINDCQNDEIDNNVLKGRILAGLAIENVVTLNNLAIQPNFVENMEKVLPYNTKFKRVDLTAETDIEVLKTVLTL